MNLIMCLTAQKNIITNQLNILLLPGARMLYKNLPRNVGLKRLTLHKSATGPNVNYILLVECSHFLDNINQVKSEIYLEFNWTIEFF